MVHEEKMLKLFLGSEEMSQWFKTTDCSFNKPEFVFQGSHQTTNNWL